MTDMSYDLRGQRVLLQARSLNNVLYVVRQRLMEMKEGLSHTVQDVQHFESVLKDIDGRWRKEGVFAKDVQEFDARMQAHCSTLFNQCFDLVTELKVTSAPMDDNMRLIFDRLCGVRKRLADLRCHQFTYADLLPLQEELDDIDSARVDGVFGGTVKEGVPKGQAVCSELLNDNYSAIEDMVDAATDMAAATRAIYTNLCGIRNALLRLKNSKHHTFEELRHYQNMLDALDSRRVDGVFGGSIKDGNIPAGQAACSEMLAKCYGLVEELKNNASEMTPEMQHIYSTLCSLHGNLKAMLKQPHSFDSVRRIQGQLDAIDGARVDGVFAGSLKDGNVPDGQATCSTLLYQCYRLVQKLYNYASDEPPAAKHAAAAAPQSENVPVNAVNA